MTIRILVTAAGGTLAPLNIRLLKASTRYDVWVLAVDARADAAGRHFADAFAQVPDGRAAGYADAVLSLIARHKINIVLPWSDDEALALAAQRKKLESAGATLACAPLSALEIMSDKTATYDLLTASGIKMPAWRKVDSAAALETAVNDFAREFGEFAVKPVTARGNRGTIVVRKDIRGVENYMGSRELHMDDDTYRRNHLAETAYPAIVMERLLPPAYDIDVLAKDGKLLRAMPRKRLNPAGIPFTGSVLMPSRPLLDLAERITSAFKLSWLYDYDLMTNAKGEPVPIEINPRPSGSIAASILAGEPFYDDLFAVFRGDTLSPVRIEKEMTVLPFMDCAVAR